MTTGNWFNSDGLPLQFGTSKATAEPGGDYQIAGSQRIVEVDVDTASNVFGAALTTTQSAVSLTTLFPTSPNIQIDKVELIGETAVATWTSFSMGFASAGTGGPFTSNGLTTISDTALLNAVSPWTAGVLTTFTASSTGAGGFIGSFLNATNMTTPGYITAKIGGSAGTGKARVRIHYHGAGTIPN